MTLTGKIIATCGHELKIMTLSNQIAIKEYDRMGNKVVSYIVVCDDCLVWYRMNNLILHNKEAEMRWLKSK